VQSVRIVGTAAEAVVLRMVTPRVYYFLHHSIVYRYKNTVLLKNEQIIERGNYGMVNTEVQRFATPPLSPPLRGAGEKETQRVFIGVLAEVRDGKSKKR
jgi:hypothetical protein